MLRDDILGQQTEYNDLEKYIESILFKPIKQIYEHSETNDSNIQNLNLNDYKATLKPLIFKGYEFSNQFAVKVTAQNKAIRENVLEPDTCIDTEFVKQELREITHLPFENANVYNDGQDLYLLLP